MTFKNLSQGSLSLIYILSHLDCQKFGPFGIGDGGVKESQLSASSQSQTVYNRASHGPYSAGLHGAKYWAPAGGLPSYDRTQYVQVEFRELKRIEMVRKR